MGSSSLAVVAMGVTGTGGCWLAMRGKNENKTENFDAT